VKFSNSPAISRILDLPTIPPFVPMSRGVCQPYRTSTNPNYRYSPINAYIAPYIPIYRGVIQPFRTTNLSYRYSPISTYCSPDTATSIQQLHETIPTPLTTQTSINLANVLSQPIPSTPTLQTAPQPPPPPQTTNFNPNISAAVYSGINPTGWVLFVHNLAPEIDENTLWYLKIIKNKFSFDQIFVYRQLFGPFGAVQTVKISRDSHTQKCKGYAFVTMTNYYDAALAINYLNGFTIGNRMLQVCFKKSNNKLF
jgi:hypothetical protein